MSVNEIQQRPGSIGINMFRFFKHRLPARVFKNSRSNETPVGPGRPSRAWVRTDYNLASVSSKGRKSGIRPVLGKRRADWTLGNTVYHCEGRETRNKEEKEEKTIQEKIYADKNLQIEENLSMTE